VQVARAIRGFQLATTFASTNLFATVRLGSRLIPTMQILDSSPRGLSHRGSRVLATLAVPKRDGSRRKLPMLLLTGSAVAVAGAFSNWDWLVALGLAPLLLSALPCLAICALGLCMTHADRSACGKAAALRQPAPGGGEQNRGGRSNVFRGDLP
jgi:hypothetical protein